MGLSSGTEEKAKVYERAETFCKKRGEIFRPLHTELTESGVGRNPAASLTFRCVKPDDPILQQPAAKHLI